ncbi:MAG: adenine phosphoribosyltransferase [Acidimicrobiales bacterium]
MTAGGPDLAALRALVRDIPDFPQPGVLFKDITPLLVEPAAFAAVIDALADHAAELRVDRVVGIEARGFVLAAPVAYRLGVGFVPLRKPGKLPHRTASVSYGLEYGADALEVHLDAAAAGHRVLLVDDVLATGGTAAAAVELLTGLGATVAAATFLIELAFLKGRARLEGQHVRALLTY